MELWPAASFSPPTILKPAIHQIQGNVTLVVEGQLEFQSIEDNLNLIKSIGDEINSLPLINMDVFSDDGIIIPVKRGVQRTSHPYWEYLLEPGKVWYLSEQWSRASIPFALSERNANCTHNGLIDFLFNSSGVIKNARIQIASETCAYLKFNLQGNLKGFIKATNITDQQQLLDSYIQERANRIPIYSIAQLALDYPELDIDALQPKDRQNLTHFGLVFNNKYYSSNCPTRAGDYPYCADLALPSYSLAKTIVAGLSYLYIASHYDNFSTIPITDFVPECQSNKWQNVTIEQLINMVSGHYQSATYMADESSDDINVFFNSETAKEKIEFSCNAYPFRDDTGSTWVYHTSDHFLAGVFMTRFMRKMTDNNSFDLYRDLLYKEILQQLKVSPLLKDTKRTYDYDAQPLAGWGLTMLADDLIKISQFITSQEHMAEHKPVIGKDRLYRILRTVYPDSEKKESSFRYQAGFWSMNLREMKICDEQKWLPIMSGYGGISELLFPNSMLYFSFTDGYQFNWAHTAIALNQINPFCAD